MARALYTALAADEVHHARLGWYYFAWRAPTWTRPEKQRLADRTDAIGGGGTDLGFLDCREQRIGFVAADSRWISASSELGTLADAAGHAGADLGERLGEELGERAAGRVRGNDAGLRAAVPPAEGFSRSRRPIWRNPSPNPSPKRGGALRLDLSPLPASGMAGGGV